MCPARHGRQHWRLLVTLDLVGDLVVESRYDRGLEGPVERWGRRWGLRPGLWARVGLRNRLGSGDGPGHGATLAVLLQQDDEGRLVVG